MALFQLVDAGFVFCFLKTYIFNDDIKKKKKNKNIIKKQTNVQTKIKIKKLEKNAPSAHFFPHQITLPSPYRARDTQMSPIIHCCAPTHSDVWRLLFKNRRPNFIVGFFLVPKVCFTKRERKKIPLKFLIDRWPAQFNTIVLLLG